MNIISERKQEKQLDFLRKLAQISADIDPLCRNKRKKEKSLERRLFLFAVIVEAGFR